MKNYIQKLTLINIATMQSPRRGPALSMHIVKFPACVHQFYANVLVFLNINPFLHINEKYALSETDTAVQSN